MDAVPGFELGVVDQAAQQPIRVVNGGVLERDCAAIERAPLARGSFDEHPSNGSRSHREAEHEIHTDPPICLVSR
ncbi:hypothetical protein BN970_01600 [Mycolicibacterium conceptionense]|uniref:Uncharacterized protein n=1 Tax=Mycolicibacterium conceptionense TaxID=451644 RepID=A0A0U1D826_9MYCO|nr:hypothetical protein BN970_01600 [Mycolicibacterium conceptionense]